MLVISLESPTKQGKDARVLSQRHPNTTSKHAVYNRGEVVAISVCSITKAYFARVANKPRATSGERVSFVSRWLVITWHYCTKEDEAQKSSRSKSSNTTAKLANSDTENPATVWVMRMKKAEAYRQMPDAHANCINRPASSAIMQGAKTQVYTTYKEEAGNQRIKARQRVTSDEHVGSKTSRVA
jgi:hypothetical protein